MNAARLKSRHRCNLSHMIKKNQTCGPSIKVSSDQPSAIVTLVCKASEAGTLQSICRFGPCSFAVEKTRHCSGGHDTRSSGNTAASQKGLEGLNDKKAFSIVSRSSPRERSCSSNVMPWQEPFVPHALLFRLVEDTDARGGELRLLAAQEAVPGRYVCVCLVLCLLTLLALQRAYLIFVGT